MTTPTRPSIHASAVLVGDRAVLIRGPSGSGKSRLAFELILAGRAGQIPPAILIGDDRLRLEARQGRLVVMPVGKLAGMIEIRGLGIRRMPHVPEAVVGLVVDLAAPDAERLPPADALRIDVAGIQLKRVPVSVGWAAFPLVAAQFVTSEHYETITDNEDCWKGFGNHIRPTLATD